MKAESPQKQYVQTLLRSFQERVRVNSSYSLRAFARDLGLSPSSLSLVLNGKQGLSKTKALQLSKKLKLSNTEEALFVSEIESAHSRSKVFRELAKTQLNLLKVSSKDVAHILSEQDFEMLSDPIYFSLLQILRLKKESHQTHHLAQRLGTTEKELQKILQTLEKKGFIQKTGKRFVVLNPYLHSESKNTSQAIRAFHAGILNRALFSISNQSPRERFLFTILFPIHTDQLQAANKALENFSKKFAKKFQNEDGNEVYALSLPFFPVTHTKEHK